MQSREHVCLKGIQSINWDMLGGNTEKAMATYSSTLLPGKSHGQRSLVGCSPWGRKEWDTTEWLHFYFSLSHASSSAWQLPAEPCDTCLLSCLIIASWAAWFVTAELHAYCLLIAWVVSAQLFEYCLLRSLFGRHLPGTSPNWSRVFEGEMA